MVKSVIDDITTYYPSAAYQVKTDGTYTNTRKYYSFNGAVVAMSENGVVTWLLQDQVNSTTVTADANGNLLSETRYSAFGEVRYSNGATVTDKLYTGQQQETEIGLDYYIARFYDPVIAHFIQPDSLISQANAATSFDRYGYSNNNPINYTDPSGHLACGDGENELQCEAIQNHYYKNNSTPEQIYRSFDEAHGGMYGGAFAEAYALLNQYNLLSSNPSSNPEAIKATAENYRAAQNRALNLVPQGSIDPGMLAGAAGIQVAGAMVSIGKDAGSSWAGT